MTHFGEQPQRPPASDVAVVACAAGPGLAAVFADAGAHVVDSGPDGGPRRARLARGGQAAHALTVILLPNDKDLLLAAEAAASAAEQDGIEFHVVRSRAAVQGLAALAGVRPAGHALPEPRLDEQARPRPPVTAP